MACTYILPAVSFDDECQSVELGQVFKFYMTRPNATDVLADVTDPDEWADRLDQTTTPGVGAAPIREFSGIGSWGDRETQDIDIPLEQIFSVPGNKVFTFKAYDLTAENLAAIIALEDAGTTRQKIWTAQGSTILGGNAGINGSMRASLIVPEGRTDLQYANIVFTTKESLNAADPNPLTIL